MNINRIAALAIAAVSRLKYTVGSDDIIAEAEKYLKWLEKEEERKL